MALARRQTGWSFIQVSKHIPGLTLGTGLALASGLALAAGLSEATGLADASATHIKQHGEGIQKRVLLKCIIKWGIGLI